MTRERAGVRRDLRFYLGRWKREAWVVRVFPDSCIVLVDTYGERGAAGLRIGDLAFTREPRWWTGAGSR